MLVSCFGLYSLFQTPGSKTIRFENENDVRVRDLTERPVFRVQSTHNNSNLLWKSKKVRVAGSLKQMDEEGMQLSNRV